MSLSRETAAKLKEAGFPQEIYGTDDCQAEFYCEHSHGAKTAIWISKEEWRKENICDGEWKADCKVPTLSELIEACRDGFLKLEKNKRMGEILGGGEWSAQSAVFTGFDTLEKGGYFSPEEAVANLYLAINKK